MLLLLRWYGHNGWRPLTQFGWDKTFVASVGILADCRVTVLEEDLKLKSYQMLASTDQVDNTFHQLNISQCILKLNYRTKSYTSNTLINIYQKMNVCTSRAAA